jgi:hypothetical protein
MVDSGCFSLAEKFLAEIEGATEDDMWDLAAAIQQACEDACNEVEDRKKNDQD